MDRNTLIIIGLIIVIFALLIGIGVTAIKPPAKDEVTLTILTNDTIYEGDSIKFKLTDVNGTPLSSQSVNVTISDENGVAESYSVVTNMEGIGALALNKTVGKYIIKCTFGGNEKYAEKNVTRNLTIKEAIKEATVVSQQTSTESSGSSASESLNYNEKYNFYYNDEGIVVDVNGHYPYIAGRTYEDVLAEAEYIDENGLI